MPHLRHGLDSQLYRQIRIQTGIAVFHRPRSHTSTPLLLPSQTLGHWLLWLPAELRVAGSVPVPLCAVEGAINTPGVELAACVEREHQWAELPALV